LEEGEGEGLVGVLLCAVHRLEAQHHTQEVPLQIQPEVEQSHLAGSENSTRQEEHHIPAKDTPEEGGSLKGEGRCRMDLGDTDSPGSACRGHSSSMRGEIYVAIIFKGVTKEEQRSRDAAMGASNNTVEM